MSFIACSQNDNEPIATTSSSSELTSEELKPGYSPLGYIPSQALAKMNKEEADVWKKVGQKMYIDYSFLDSTFYVNNKTEILKDFMCLYDKVLVKSDSVSYLAFARCYREGNKGMFAHKRMATRSETGQDDKGGAYIGNAVIWSKNDYRMEVFVRVIFGTDGRVIDAGDVEKTCIPGTANFTGTLGHEIHDGNNFMKVTANGYFQLNDKSYRIENSVTVYLHKE